MKPISFPTVIDSDSLNMNPQVDLFDSRGKMSIQGPSAQIPALGGVSGSLIMKYGSVLIYTSSHFETKWPGNVDM